MLRDSVERLMEKGIRDGVFPGAVLLTAWRGEILHHQAYGVSNLKSRTPVTEDTVFDLASLTKPLATTLAVMKLIESGRLGLDQPLKVVLPESARTGAADIRIGHLLAHHSGLPDHRPYYERLGNAPGEKKKSALRQWVLAEPLVHPIGREVLYSDLGFMLLEWVVERLSNMRLDAFVAKTVYSPLSLDRLFFVDLEKPRPEEPFAATERCPWRGRILEGCVHDENAFISGGIQGHAGLFGAARAVYDLLSGLLSAYYGEDAGHRADMRPFQRDLVRRFFRPFEDTGRSLGFDRPSPTGSSCGSLFSRNAVGHLGFTGASFWMDLDRCLVVVLLTNRVHPTRDNLGIREFRPMLHDAVIEGIRAGTGRRSHESG